MGETSQSDTITLVNSQTVCIYTKNIPSQTTNNRTTGTRGTSNGFLSATNGMEESWGFYQTFGCGFKYINYGTSTPFSLPLV